MIEEIIFAIALVLSILVIWALVKMSGMKKALDDMKSRFDVVAAPADTLTQVATTLQQNAMALSSSIAGMNKSIGDIGQQAVKIETLGKKYEETESLTRRIYNIMIGSYEKGKSGENYLRNMMNELMKIGLVREKVPIGNNVVEYGVVFSDGKILAIDSKVVSTHDTETLLDEKTSDQDREALRKKIKNALANKVIEVCKYIDPKSTLPCAVMAIPDSLVNLTTEIVPEAVKRNVMIAGYSAVPQLIVYFIRIHGFYSIKEDVAEMKGRLETIHQEMTKLDDRFFSNRFERPISMLTKALLDLRQTIARIDSVLSLENRAPPELAEEEKETNA
ncbi:DNA recombination protein RmuC [Candidatus Bathyarchaeota archaeon]|nr:DNA recombination protein RmuC [Candidatus Bathyarchaeota archaeon]